MASSIMSLKDISQFHSRADLENVETSTASFVKLYMGPYEANGIIRHRLQRLKGLLDFLAKKRYNVELVASKHIDRFSLEFYQREIFRCNIKEFQFNLPAEEDPLCQQVIQVLEEHEGRFCSDENIPKFVSDHHGMRFLEFNKYYTTADRLSASDIELMFEINDNLGAVESKMNKETSSSSSEHLSLDAASDKLSLSIDISDEDLFKTRVARKSFDIAADELKSKTKMIVPGKYTSEELLRRVRSRHLAEREDGNQSQNTESKLTMVRMDMDEGDPAGHFDIYDRATKNLRQLRASFMLKSGEIQSVEAFKSVIASTMDFRDYSRPELKNQKIISKVLSRRKEKMGEHK